MSKSSSLLVLIAANFIPLFGVVLFDWDVLDILLLYWTESVIIGALNVLRMFFCHDHWVMERMIEVTNRPSSEQVGQDLQIVSAKPDKERVVQIFIVCYMSFCAAHLAVIAKLFGHTTTLKSSGYIATLAELLTGPLLIAVAAIFGSHLYSFFTNYIGGGEYKRTKVSMLTYRPYGRVAVMQMAILFGAGLDVLLGSPLRMLLVLIVGKTLVDMSLHEIEHSKLAAAA